MARNDAKTIAVRDLAFDADESAPHDLRPEIAIAMPSVVNSLRQRMKERFTRISFTQRWGLPQFCSSANGEIFVSLLTAQFTYGYATLLIERYFVKLTIERCPGNLRKMHRGVSPLRTYRG